MSICDTKHAKKEDINKTSYKNKILQIYTLLFNNKPNVEAVSVFLIRQNPVK